MGFVALELALEIWNDLQEPLKELRKKDRYLYDEAKRAGGSMCLNTAEGSRRVGGDKTHFYNVAAGSVKELRTTLQMAIGWGLLSGLDWLLAKIDREGRLLSGLTREGRPGARSPRARGRAGRRYASGGPGR